MTHTLKEELVRLLEVRTVSNFEKRKRRLLSIPLDVLPEALNMARDGLPLTTNDPKEIQLRSPLAYAFCSVR